MYVIVIVIVILLVIVIFIVILIVIVTVIASNVSHRYRDHRKDVRFIRGNKKEKERRGTMCATAPDKLLPIGSGEQFGLCGVYGSGENDGAAQWYTNLPTDGSTKGKHRVPSNSIQMKCLVRVIHGCTILVTLVRMRNTII